MPSSGQDVEAVLRQVEVADDLRPEQADDVARDREAEARDDLLGDRRAAEHVAPLEDERLEAGPRQVGGGDEPVVPSADDHRVVALRHASLQSERATGCARVRGGGRYSACIVRMQSSRRCVLGRPACAAV